MADGPTGRLPLLTGSRNLVTGTYLAEQISSVCTDLVSEGARPPAQHKGKAGAVSPSLDGNAFSASPRSRRKKNAGEKFVKCTRLPALEDIDTLFRDGAGGAQVAGDTWQWQERLGAGTVPPESEQEDQEFREWLRLPRIAESPREEPEEGTSWNLLLSQKTLRTLPAERVTAALMQVLSLEPHTAVQKVAELRRRRLIALDRYQDKGEAFIKLQKLRSQGLQAQVAMDFGLPGDGHQRIPHHSSVGRSSPSVYTRSYTELFHRAGAEKSGARHAIRPDKNRAGLAHWRSAQNSDFEQPVMPEDPVEALFLAEGEQQKKVTAGRSRKGLLQVMVNKHKPQIARRASENRGRGIGRGMSFASTALDALTGAKVELASEAHASVPEGGHPTHTAARKGEEASAARKEACLLLRFFVFGCFGNEDAKDARERDAVFYESLGQREQVKLLHRIWNQLDKDSSGRVDFSEFRTFAEQHIRTRIEGSPATDRADGPPRRAPAERGAPARRMLQAAAHSLQDLVAQATEDVGRFTAALCEKLSSMLLGKKSSFAIEDMIRLLWLGAKVDEIKTMKGWCREFYEEAARNRVDTPPVLDSVEYAGLSSVFEHFDEDRKGEILFESLVAKGLIYSEQVEEYRRAWDNNGDGVLSLPEFCEMMCPVGFRATSNSDQGSLPDGRRIYYHPEFGCWKTGEDGADYEIMDASKDAVDLE